jgi:large conductance mechanosensitive channel
MLTEFRKFALRGNVVDLAIGVIIGAAFSKIVDSLVSDIIMPAIGAVTGGLDFSNYYLPLTSAIQDHPAYADAKKAGAVLGYGQFLTVAINFLIIAFILFLVVREISKLERIAGLGREEAAPTKSEKLLAEIRDLLAKH